MSEERNPRRVPLRPVGRGAEEQLEARPAPPPRSVVAPERVGARAPRRPLPDELSVPRRPPAAQSRTTASPAEDVGAELAAVLRSRTALRRAVLLNEILGRPVALRDELP